MNQILSQFITERTIIEQDCVVGAEAGKRILSLFARYQFVFCTENLISLNYESCLMSSVTVSEMSKMHDVLREARQIN